MSRLSARRRLSAPVIAAAIALAVFAAAPASAASSAAGIARAIDTARLSHPYLYFSEADKPALRARIQSDPEARDIMARLTAEANRLLFTPVETTIPAEQKHPRYWTDGAHDALVNGYRKNILILAFVYQMTDDPRYAKKAFEFADVLCDIKLWNYRAHEFPIIYSRVWPRGVKDDQTVFTYDIRSGDMASELGTAYDWLYPALSKAERDRIRGALLGNAVLLVRNNYDYHWWATAYRCNWCGICFSGFGVASLALLTENPELVDGIAEAYDRIGRMFDEYDPDGGWQEGRSYWAYGMRACVFYMDALNRLTGRKYNLFAHPAIRNNPASFALWGLTGYFGDGSGAAVGSPHLLNKLADETGDAAAAYYRSALLGPGTDMFDIIWPRSTVAPVEPPVKSRLFRGLGWAFMRSGFTSPGTVTIACKAGMNDDPHHGHLDAGQFILTWRGEAFITDLGSGKYFYDEKYFDEARWTYVTAGSEGHNLIFVDGETQRSAKYKDKPWTPGVGGKILEFRTGADRDYTLMDNTAAYSGEHLRGWRRHLVLDKPVITVLLDEVKSAKGASIEARFHSDCALDVRDGFALLTGAKGTMAVIPVAADSCVLTPGRHPYLPVRKDAAFTWIPYLAATVTASAETTRLATVILPVRDGAEAAEIAASVVKSPGPDTFSFSFTQGGKTCSYTFTGRNGLVLAQ